MKGHMTGSAVTTKNSGHASTSQKRGCHADTDTMAVTRPRGGRSCRGGGGKIGIAEEEGGGGGIGEKKGGWARGRGDTRTGEETRARAPWRGGANQASDRHQFGGDHAESRGGGFGLGTRPGSGADPSRVGGCVRQVLHPAGA